jgi:foldase protein PrsA
VRRRWTATLLGTAVIAVGVLASACGGLPSSAVAKVGDVYIDKAQFDAQVTSYASQYGVDATTDPEGYQSLSQSVADSLITTELAVQKAPSMGITVTEAEVQAKIDSIITDYYSGDESALVTDLANEAMTMDDLKKQVGDFIIIGLVRDQVVKDITAPSDEEIATYYETNKADFLTEQTVDARHILVAIGGSVQSAATTTTTTASTDSTDTTATTASTTATTVADLTWARALATAAQVRADLLAGGSWSRLASRYSADTDTKGKGGNLGTVTQGSLIDTLGQEFDTALFSLTLDQVSEPVQTAKGYEIIQVTKITEPQQKTLEEAKVEISALLLSTAQEAAWQAFVDKAKLDIRVVYRAGLAPTTTTTLAPVVTTTSEGTATTAKP